MDHSQPGGNECCVLCSRASRQFSTLAISNRDLLSTRCFLPVVGHRKVVGVMFPDGLGVALRRFVSQPLTGSDLGELRNSLLGLSQEQLGELWTVSRIQISRIETLPIPPQKQCDAYIGLMVRLMMERMRTDDSVMSSSSARTTRGD